MGLKHFLRNDGRSPGGTRLAKQKARPIEFRDLTPSYLAFLTKEWRKCRRNSIRCRCLLKKLRNDLRFRN